MLFFGELKSIGQNMNGIHVARKATDAGRIREHDTHIYLQINYIIFQTITLSSVR